MMLNHAWAKTPTPGKQWLEMDNDNRMRAVIMRVISAHFHQTISVVAAQPNGYVTIEFIKPLSANERGTFLLDLEEYLQANVDLAITVWLRPQGDKNSLRNLRGISMNAIRRNVASSTAIETGQSIEDIERDLRDTP